MGVSAGVLRVLTYHRVANPADAPGLNPRLISTTPAVFARQMRYLSQSYKVISMAAVLDAVANRKPLPKRVGAFYS